MHKRQMEEMRDFLSQKKAYEEICTILQARHPDVREYSVKPVERFCKKTFTKFAFLSNRVYSFCETLRTLLAF